MTVQSILRMCRASSEQTKRLEQRLGNLEQLQTKSVEAMKELSKLIKKQELASFSIKHSSFEVWKYTLILLTSEIIINQTFFQLPLKIEAARIFCLSPIRNPSISKINVSIAN